MGAICLLGTLYDFWYIMTEPSENTEDSPESNGKVPSDGDAEVLIPSKKSNPRKHGKFYKRSHCFWLLMFIKNYMQISLQQCFYGYTGKLGEFLMCFSLYTNGYKLLSTKQPPGSLNCLNGIRFLSMCWVILGHAIVFSVTSIGKYLYR